MPKRKKKRNKEHVKDEKAHDVKSGIKKYAPPLEENSRRPWQKILYLEQDYPDNYTPPSFLDCVTVNRDLEDRTLWSIIMSALWIADEVMLCVCFFTIFELQFSGFLSHDILLSISIILIPVGYFILYILGHSMPFRKFIVPIYVVLLILTLFTPVLGSLTQSWSDDTLFFIAVILAFFHCIVHPYSDLLEDFRPALSINTILLSSLLLSSRFRTVRSTMVFLIYSFVQFILFPIAWSRLKIRYTITTTLFLFLMMIFLGSYCTHMQRALPFVTCLLGFIVFICPGWLKWLDQFKMRIEAPWNYDTEAEFADTCAISTNVLQS